MRRDKPINWCNVIPTILFVIGVILVIIGVILTGVLYTLKGC